ncbi:unnamed protein product, partial [Ilex paraguariensis]
ARLNKVAADVVKKLLPVSAGNDLGSLCSWADRVKIRYRWSSPLHVGFTSDKGGNTINVTWYNRKAVLHHVWDSSIIETEEKTFCPADVNQVINNIQLNITTIWAKQVKAWETCPLRQKTCPNIYASESVKAACQWAYKGVRQGSVLQDAYFRSRLPIVSLRLAQAGVRLAATLNKIFK